MTLTVGTLLKDRAGLGRRDLWLVAPIVVLAAIGCASNGSDPQPMNSAEDAIAAVIRHIERGQPIIYTEPLPTEEFDQCGDPLEVGVAWGPCVEAQRARWEAAGRPVRHVTWREDEECWEWDRTAKIDPSLVFPLTRLINSARYFPAQTWEEAFGGSETLGITEPDELDEFERWVLRPHWKVYGTSAQDGGCWWVFDDEDARVVYAIRR